MLSAAIAPSAVSAAGCAVQRAVVLGTEEGVDEEPGDVDVVRVDGREVVDHCVPEVEVGAVRLVGELAQLCVALARPPRYMRTISFYRDAHSGSG